MLNKVYLAILAIAVFLMLGFVYYSNSWLDSIGAPSATKENYEFYAGLTSTTLWISSLILLIVANGILWQTRRGWALWTTFLYFAVFTIARYFWLEQSFFAYKKSNGLWQGEFSISPLIGVGLVIGFGALVFVNQFVNLRLNEKMYPPPAEISAETEPVQSAES